jgi:hypothetical protein
MLIGALSTPRRWRAGSESRNLPQVLRRAQCYHLLAVLLVGHLLVAVGADMCNMAPPVLLVRNSYTSDSGEEETRSSITNGL